MADTHGFTLLREEYVDEINSTARIYKHEKSGAELLSVLNDDENKVFGITFRTPVDKSDGLPHILEHCVLGGSKKYPIKEPFTELIKSSLNTFLNAMTYSEKTVYPVASTNLKDFYNLVDVYLDAVLNPLITPHHLDQEGWHYELEDIEDPLVYRGVVFNEMKGAYSSPEGSLYRHIEASLFDPSHPYGHDSGGDPAVIPTLTYDKFKTFYDTYYHPSNAQIYFYGDDPEEERLSKLADYLDEYAAQSVDSIVTDFPLRDQIERKTFPYSVEEGQQSEDKHYVTINWLLPVIRESETMLALSILSHVLSGTAGSPLQRALMESGLGEDTIGGGFSGGIKQYNFTSGMKGVTSDNIEKVETLILETLVDLVKNGIDKEAIEASLNTTEFRLRESNTGSFPRGLMYMLNSVNRWLYGDDPIEGIRYEAALTSVKAKLEAGNYFESLLQKYLLENNHRVTVVLEPSTTLAADLEAAEQAELEAAKAQMDRADLEAIIKNTKALKLRQDTPDDPADVAKIPKLTLDDIEREVKELPAELIQTENGKILFHDLFTNGIVYFRVGFNLRTLPQELLQYLPLFNSALTEMGTSKEDYIRLGQRIGRLTGGVGAGNYIDDELDGGSAQTWLFARGKSTLAQTGDMLSIVNDILTDVNFDNRERFMQMVLEEKAGQEAMLIPRGHGVIMSRLRAGYSEAGWLGQQLGGIEYLFFLRKLVEEVQNDWPSVCQKLQAIQAHLINRQTMLVDVTLDADNFQAIKPQLEAFMGGLPSFDPAFQTWNRTEPGGNEGLTMPSQVNYVGKMISLREHGVAPHNSIRVISNMFNTGYLWETIRAKGGAYGAFMPYNGRTGTLSFASYRDPNIVDTLAAYDAAAEHIRHTPWTQTMIESAIIGVIGDMDGYQLPDAKGRSALYRFLHGVTTEYRQQKRDEVLNTTVEDFNRFASTLDLLAAEGRIAILGATDKLTELQERYNLELISVM